MFLSGAPYNLMVIQAELHGYRKRWAAHSNGEEISGDSGSPAAVMESEPCRASEGNRSEVDVQSNFADDVEAQSSSSTGISNFSYASQLNTQQTGVVTALSILRSAKRVKLPWETGPLAQVFSRDDFSRRFEIRPQTIGLSDVLNPQPKVRAATPANIVLQSSHSAVRKRIVLTTYNIHDDELRSRALNRFKILVCLDLSATGIGRSMLNCMGKLDSSTDVLQVLEDALASKATGTLLKRASSLWRWANWLAASGKGTCFVQTEATVYQYMNYLRDSGSAPTSASHFVEAVRFAEQVFKLVKMNVQAVLTSRVTGAAHNMFLQKRKLMQAPPFSVQAVSAFEDICIHDNRSHVRAICGSILFCIFACVRWFDAMRIESLQLDKYITMSLLEASTSKHKNINDQGDQDNAAPLHKSWPIFGISRLGREFCECKIRERLAGSGSLFAVLEWVGAVMVFLSDVFRRSHMLDQRIAVQCRSGKNEMFSSHSAKCTLLTWAGMTTLFLSGRAYSSRPPRRTADEICYYLQSRLPDFVTIQGAEAYQFNSDEKVEAWCQPCWTLVYDGW